IKEAKDYERNAAIMRKYSLRHLIFKRKDLKHALGKLGLTKDTIRHNIMLFEEICGRYDYDRASYVSNPSGKYGVKNIFRKEIYGEGTTVDFMDFHIRIPSEYDFYLKQYYGDYMKFPPEDMIKKEMEKTFTLR
ncbi:MAG: LicD family protein, partial [Lachnospiraceae bacterium]|nr:LicD family protein [Lachnospiraceae bacterium]